MKPSISTLGRLMICLHACVETGEISQRILIRKLAERPQRGELQQQPPVDQPERAGSQAGGGGSGVASAHGACRTLRRKTNSTTTTSAPPISSANSTFSTAVSMNVAGRNRSACSRTFSLSSAGMAALAADSGVAVLFVANTVALYRLLA
mgnify:CR=1 FL=1